MDVDEGAQGFLSIYGSDAADSTDNPSQDADSSQMEATAADEAAPDEVDQDDLSAEDIVAARFAASLEDDGIEIPEPGDESVEMEGDDEHPLLAEGESDTDLDTMTPEQLRALAAETIALRQQVSQSDKAEVARKVADAERQAVADVQTAYQREVLEVSADHYGRIFQERLERTGYEPEAIARLRAQVNAAQQQWEAEQYAAYDLRAVDAAKNARKNVPELRKLYATELLTQRGITDARAVDDLLKTRDTDDFVARADELVAIRDALLKERERNRQQRRKDANKQAAANTVRTPATGRPKGGKPPAYKGTAEEGARILGMMHRR